MEESTAEAFANRDEPVPLIEVISNDGLSSDSSERKRDRLLSSSKKQLSPDVGVAKSKISSLQDRLFTKLLQQVIPSEDVGGDGLETPDKRSTKYVGRPGFSLPLMTTNFRRFNARIGVVFVFQTRLIRLISWKTPSHTLSLLAVSTFVCLDPYLLAVLPILVALFSVMVPAYLARHPPPPPVVSQTPSYSINGPPLAPPRVVRPASETSKDFFRNLRDLQNSMDDFSTAHDALLKAITPVTNFSNEPLSSTIFLFLFTAACVLFISSHLLPWRLLSLSVWWTAIALGHPKIQTFILSHREEHIRPHERAAQSWLDRWISQDILLDAPAETREVEIFELQRRKGGRHGEWESWVFSPSPYDPLSPQRISGDRPKGTRFFEDVEAPSGWEWGDKKWVLDLWSKEWVDERMVQGVEVEIEGERWVGDLANEEVAEYSGDEKAVSVKGKERKRDYEYRGTSSMMGEWRRRRWIRTVRRKVVGNQERSVANAES
ncbi:hypothetical protein MMC22_006772 [Lobaria immixta]|nr:hypothetical protein [Lobaria immixta]